VLTKCEISPRLPGYWTCNRWIRTSLSAPDRLHDGFHPRACDL